MVYRRIAAMFLAIAGLCSGLLGCSSGALVEHTIQNSLIIDRQFKQAAAAVKAFEAAKGRLPSSEEFKFAHTKNPADKYEVALFAGNFDQCDDDVFHPKDDSEGPYLLTVWRGEWMECYSPTTGQSTVTTNRADYFVTGSLWLDHVVFGTLAMASLLLAVKLWQKKPVV
ncbi:MAG: hypothetical protein SFV20_10050 [Sphingopyxis sp.]|nr:hypothetical protein [Sphingopyxis sp.]